MSSRKQRRRRAKTFRHEYVWVKEDEEGNEVEVAPDELPTRKERPEKPRAAKTPAKGKSAAPARGRSAREPSPPSWRRSLKRGGIWGGIVLITVLFLFQDMPLGARVAWGLLYALLFIPLTYWVDRMVYRSYLRRLAKTGKQ